MAKIDRLRIIETFNSYKIAELVKTKDPVYDMMLKITLHGNPISDSRPRYSGKTGMFFNPHKEAMKKLFKPIYDSDGILKELILDKICKVKMKAYYMPTKGLLKDLGMKNIMKETFPSIIKKDNDNVEKIHWDILHDWNFKILLDDNLIVYNSTEKFLSMDERIELEIHFCSSNDNIHVAYDKEIRNGLTYIYTLLNPKFILKNGLHANAEIFNAYVTTVVQEFKLNKKKTFRKTLLKTMNDTRFPKEWIYNLVSNLDNEVGKKMIYTKREDLVNTYVDMVIKKKYKVNSLLRQKSLRLIEGGLCDEFIRKHTKD